MTSTATDIRPTTSRRTTIIAASVGAVITLAAVFALGRASVDEGGRPFQGTVVVVSGDQDAIAVKPTDGDQIDGVLAYAEGPDLVKGDVVSGEVFTTSTGGAVIHVDAR